MATILAPVVDSTSPTNLLGPWNSTADSILFSESLISEPATESTWLTQEVAMMPSGTLHYTVANNSKIDFVPYFEVQEELFEVYPAFNP